LGGIVSQLSTGAYTPGSSPGDDPSKVKQVAGQTKESAGQAATEVKQTATQQAQRVGAEAKTQARNVAGEVRDRLGEQAKTQNDRLVGTIRQTADHLDEMRGDRADSPAATVVSRVAEGGRQFADYLDRNGPEGVLREVQDFARRRPGAFLATALAAGFVVGRLGKSVAQADPNAGAKPSGDTYSSAYAGTPDTTPTADYATTTGAGAAYTGSEGTGYPATTGVDPVYPETTYPATGTTTAYPSTEYAATGTGTPAAVESDEYPLSGRETRP
jgi:hypothetical protein